MGIAIIALIGKVSPLSFFAVNMLTFMGLAVGIDYSLFVVSRFREERAPGPRRSRRDRAVAGTTAGRAVVFSGMTVVLALVGMLIVPTKIFISLAVGAIVVVLVAVVAALTLLPAILRLLGDRVNTGRIPFFEPHAQRGPPSWHLGAPSHGAMRHPPSARSSRGVAAARARSRRFRSTPAPPVCPRFRQPPAPSRASSSWTATSQPGDVTPARHRRRRPGGHAATGVRDALATEALAGDDRFGDPTVTLPGRTSWPW